MLDTDDGVALPSEIYESLRRQIELINGRPMTRKERAVLANFLLQAPIEDETDKNGSLRSPKRPDLGMGKRQVLVIQRSRIPYPVIHVVGCLRRPKNQGSALRLLQSPKFV
jgi:hypothetical protein